MKFYPKDRTIPNEVSNDVNFGPEKPDDLRRSIPITPEQFKLFWSTSKLFKTGLEYYTLIGVELDKARIDHFKNRTTQLFFYNLEISEELTGLELIYIMPGKDKYGPHGGYVSWNIDPKLDIIEIYEEVYVWAKSIGANLYYDTFGKTTRVTDDFLELLRIKLGARKSSTERIMQHTLPTEGRILAIEAGEANAVLDFLKKKMPKPIAKKILTELKPWDEAYEYPREDELIMTPSIGGWVFISGLFLDVILPESKSEDDTDKWLDGINQVSKKFKKARWFEYSSDYNLKAYIKSEKGTIKYGVLQSEEENRVIGTKPRELGKEEDPDINFIASKWALDPDTFLYMPVLKNANVTIIKFKGGLDLFG